MAGGFPLATRPGSGSVIAARKVPRLSQDSHLEADDGARSDSALLDCQIGEIWRGQDVRVSIVIVCYNGIDLSRWSLDDG